jgi:hypothetical protein
MRMLLGQAKTVVNEGMFVATGFRNGALPHGAGWYTVEVLAYFNGPWAQSDAVLEITGRDGQKLVGRFAEPLHPGFADSEKRFRAAFECVAPPLKGTPPRTAGDLQSAIETVQSAVLTVDGRQSACPIRDVVDWFMSSPGLRRHEGWSATPLPNGGIVVRFSFWNSNEPATAEWIVILETQAVRYWNLNGKYMSWMSDD